MSIHKGIHDTITPLIFESISLTPGSWSRTGITNEIKNIDFTFVLQLVLQWRENLKAKSPNINFLCCCNAFMWLNLFHLDPILKIQKISFINCFTFISFYKWNVDKRLHIFKDNDTFRALCSYFIIFVFMWSIGSQLIIVNKQSVMGVNKAFP